MMMKKKEQREKPNHIYTAGRTEWKKKHEDERTKRREQRKKPKHISTVERTARETKRK